MGTTEDKIKKKEAKAELKARKKEAKARQKRAKDEAELEKKTTSEKIKQQKKDVSVKIEKQRGSSNLVIKGLSEDQLHKILPEINKEILITLTRENSPVKASFMRFIREGATETLIKVIAGLIVGYLLIQFGLK